MPCDERVQGAFDKLQEFLPEGENVKYIKVVEKTATTDVIQRRMTDTITANPDANFVVAALDDPSAGGAFNAIRQAGLEDRARIASIGGDNLAVENLLKGSPSVRRVGRREALLRGVELGRGGARAEGRRAVRHVSVHRRDHAGERGGLPLATGHQVLT